MEKTDLVLGIDTSCYTTSAALMDGTGALLFDERRLLRVKEGRRGCPNQKWSFSICGPCQILERIDLTQGRLSAIVASERPRPLKESYMPAFLVGWGMARSLSHFMDVPLIAATHQHNHMFAGLWGLRRRPPARCLLVHVSGGTTDLLLAERSANGEIILTPCGTSIDLHAGQMIDRVGVALGLPFPCGPQLEKIGTGSSPSLSSQSLVRRRMHEPFGSCHSCPASD